MSKQQTEEGRVEVLPVQWRKHLNLEVGTCLSGCSGCFYINPLKNLIGAGHLNLAPRLFTTSARAVELAYRQLNQPHC